MLTPVMRLRTLALLGAGGVALYRMAQQLGVPDGVVPVQPFQLSRYLGRWYEIARIDHVYERGLTDTSADYRLLPGGQVQVTNRGYHPGARRWREVRARAQPVPGVGELLIGVTASGVNRPDVLQRKGYYAPPPGASPKLCSLSMSA